MSDRADFCGKIAQVAADTKARSDALKQQGELAQTAACMFGGLVNPRCYKNEAKNDAVNFNMQYSYVDASTNDRITSTTGCANDASSSQLNSISNKDCPYCQTNMCYVTNVTQENVDEMRGECIANNSIRMIMEKKLDAQSLGMIKAVQEAGAKGPVAEAVNSTVNAACTQQNVNMSSNQIIDVISKCKNEFNSLQQNKLEVCGAATNIVQRNVANKFLKCVAENSTDATFKEEIKTKIVTDTAVEQKATADNSLFGSLAALLICCCSICIISSVISLLMGGMSGMSGGKE
jgi:hypothetical protein